MIRTRDNNSAAITRSTFQGMFCTKTRTFQLDNVLFLLSSIHIDLYTPKTLSIPYHALQQNACTIHIIKVLLIWRRCEGGFADKVSLRKTRCSWTASISERFWCVSRVLWFTSHQRCSCLYRGLTSISLVFSIRPDDEVARPPTASQMLDWPLGFGLRRNIRETE